MTAIAVVFCCPAASAAMPPPQAVHRRAIVTRASRSRARLISATNSRRFVAKPRTPHPITRKGYATSVRQQSCQRLCNAQRVQLFKLQTANVGGRGVLPSRSLGGPRGIFSFLGKRISPFDPCSAIGVASLRHKCRKTLCTCAKKQIFLKTETFSIFLRLKR